MSRAQKFSDPLACSVSLFSLESFSHLQQSFLALSGRTTRHVTSVFHSTRQTTKTTHTQARFLQKAVVRQLVLFESRSTKDLNPFDLNSFDLNSFDLNSFDLNIIFSTLIIGQ